MSLGASTFTEKILYQIFDEGPQMVSPFLFTDCVASAPTGQLSIALGVRGASYTICQREAGPVLALRRAVAELRRGRADLVFTGAVEELSPLSVAMLDRFRALARPRAGEELPRPFDLQRNGVLAGEGATVMTLETEAGARARGANLGGRIRCVDAAFDASAPAHDWGTGAAPLARRLASMLDGAGLRLGDIDLVVSGAAGSLRGDRLEARVLREVFGDAMPAVIAPKAVVGEFHGGVLAAACLALEGAAFARPVGCTAPDPELGIELRDWRPSRPPARVLLTAHASGGAAAYAVFERVE
jgi:3-oxoacyl-(acyl-carrier-protein) synthase